MTKRVTPPVDNDTWLRKHLEELVDKYAGEFVVISAGKLYRNGTPQELLKKAKSEHPNIIPLFFRVPRPEDFISILICLR